jgi:hypothetical protein
MLTSSHRSLLTALTQQFNKHKMVLRHHFPYLAAIRQEGYFAHILLTLVFSLIG